MPTILQSNLVPNGLDWADGLSGRPGSPTSSKALIIQQSGTAIPGVVIEEAPDSPEIERGEQATIRHRFRMDFLTASIYLAGLGRGVLLQDSFGNISKIQTTTLRRMTGNMAELVVVAEGVSFDNPPDEFRLEVIELNPALEKHPRYAFLPADARDLVNRNANSAQILGQKDALVLIASLASWNPNKLPQGVTWTWAIAQIAANELLLKRRVGEDTFYLPGFRVSWSQYYWYSPPINPGGYIEDPILNGGLPAYFWNPNWPLDPADTNDNIFKYCAKVNPQLYSDGTNFTFISWLRQCDNVEYARTWFRITRTWIGAPYAHWDADIYTNKPSPYPPPPDRVVS
jgi:hypothetical protein